MPLGNFAAINAQVQRRLRQRALASQEKSNNVEIKVNQRKGFKLALKASTLLPHPTPLEEEFFKYVEQNLTDAVLKIILENPDFNVNCLNSKGYTGLSLAVKAGSIDVVELLLNVPGVQIGDAVLQAVKTSDDDIVALIIEKLELLGYDTTGDWYVESPDFSPDVTPLMLAAQLNDLLLVRYFLEHNHLITVPHSPGCTCEDCYREQCENSLLASKRRLNAYKAFASPVYIFQTSRDPILTTMELSNETEQIATIEREYKTEYLELAEQCAQLAVDLLEHCRTTAEVQVLLSQQATCTSELEQDDLVPRQPDKVARLSLAVGYNQKKFVAHPNCQILLRSLYLGDWQDWKQLSLPGKFLRLVPRTLGLPIVALVYWFAPTSNLSRSWQSPINKFMSFAAAYLVFLFILVVQDRLQTRSHDLRGPPRTKTEGFIGLFIVGLIYRDIEQMGLLGVKRFFSSKWSQYNMVMNLLFLTAFSCWLLAWIDTEKKADAMLPRKFWRQHDPTLIGEAIYSIAVVFAFGRLFYFFQVSQELGPLQVSLSRMFRDIMHFLVVIVTVMVSFSLGIHKVYHYYRDQVQVVNGVTTQQTSHYTTFSSTLFYLFWALYGYSPPEYGNLVLAEHVETVGNNTIVYVNKHSFTQTVGYTMLTIYNIIAIIILVNVFIAMMSNSFMAVETNADMEWKFGRTKVWLPFFSRGENLPPPFNIVPSPACIVNALAIFHNVDYSGTFKPLNEDTEAYRYLIGQLVLRYLCKRLGYVPSHTEDHLGPSRNRDASKHLGQSRNLDSSRDLDPSRHPESPRHVGPSRPSVQTL